MRMILTTAALAVALASSGCGPVNDEAQFKVAAQELNRDMAAANSGDPKNPPPIDPKSQAKGKAGAFSRTVKGYIIKTVADRKAYHEELEAIALTAATTPEALAAEGGLAKARAAVAKNRALVIKNRDLNAKRLADLRQEMRAAGPRSPVIEGFERGLDRSLGTQGGAVAEIFGVQLETLDEVDRMINDLEKAEGRWEAQGGQLAFSDVGDMTTFNNHMMTIRMAETKERMIIMRANVANSLTSSRLDSLSKK